MARAVDMALCAQGTGPVLGGAQLVLHLWPMDPNLDLGIANWVSAPRFGDTKNGPSAFLKSFGCRLAPESLG